MNSRKIEQLYKSHTENTAPDMDALWERIESKLDEKNDEAITSKPIRRSISLAKKAALAAACVAAVVIIPAAIRNTSISDSNMATDSAAASPMAESPVFDAAAEDFAYEATDGGAYDDEAFSNVSEYDTVLYEDLDLNYAEVPEVLPYAETAGDDFFVEETVLIETDIIVNAYVDKVYSDGNGSMVYELTAGDLETGKTESLCFTSATPYVMLEGRCYVIPLKKDGEIYSLAFENAPQIEMTNDGGYIFHNGWECLNVNAADVVYPQGGVDDFFYDRMKFSYGSIDVLVEKWLEIKE